MDVKQPYSPPITMQMTPQKHTNDCAKPGSF